jgi:hypothetical protein
MEWIDAEDWQEPYSEETLKKAQDNRHRRYETACTPN